MNILICPDSLKNCLSAQEVGEFLKRGILSCREDVDIRILPLADGGEGTLASLSSVLDIERVECQVHDPLMRQITAEYGIINGGTNAIIEMSSASGIELLEKEELNPLITTTYGTGELIKDALERGCRKIVLGIGGSATNDCGAGMFQALGGKLLDADGDEVGRGGAVLEDVAEINTKSIHTLIKETEFIIACDVKNPLLGENGASYIYGRQKGASEEDVQVLDFALKTFSLKIENTFGVDVVSIPGAGAAGGLGAGSVAFLNGKIQSGFSIIADMLDLNESISWADLIITGEGKIDSQTIQGKVPWYVAQYAKQYSKPVVAVAGIVDSTSDILFSEGIRAILPIANKPLSVEDSIKNAPKLLTATGRSIMSLISVGMELKTD